MSGYDVMKIYNKTGHYGRRGASAEIPFTGSGISLFVFCDVRYACGLNVSIDGSTLTPHWRSAESNVVYNVSMCDVQGLYSDVPHNLYIEPWDDSSNFDYVLVNDTPYPPRQLSSKMAKAVGPAVGGVVGGIVVIAGVAFLVLSLRRRQAARDAVEIDPDPKSSAYDDIPPIPIATIPALNSTAPHAEARHTVEPTSSMRSPQPDITVQTIAVPLVEQHTTPPANTSPRIPQPNASGNELSEEQAGFVHDLYDLNVPAPAIASVINEMVRRRDGSGGGLGAGVVPGTTWSRHEEPPNYNV